MNEDKLIMAVVETQERVKRIEEDMYTKNDGQKMMSVLEGIATIVKKIQDDHVEEEIKQIKMKLQMA